MLSDIVRVIRTFRPDILITRFPPEPSGTHGHHTASSALALEAFRLSGDPKAFPEQLDALAPWQPRRILWNGYGPALGGPAASPPGALKVDIDGTDPVTGATFGVLAARSRSMHRTQGFANFSVAAAGSGPRIESFQLLDGDPATTDIMDGIDTTWGRVAGGADIGRLADAVIAQFDPQNPSASVPALLEIKGRLAALAAGSGRRREAPAARPDPPGLPRAFRRDDGLAAGGRAGRDRSSCRHTAIVQSSVPVQWAAVRYPGYGRETTEKVDLVAGQPSEREATRKLPADTPLSQPYWLREQSTPGMFRVDDPALIGLPENPPPLPVEDVFVVGRPDLGGPRRGGVCLVGPGEGDVRRRPDVIPPVSLSFDESVALFAPGSTRNVEVELVASRALTRPEP